MPRNWRKILSWRESEIKEGSRVIFIASDSLLGEAHISRIYKDKEGKVLGLSQDQSWIDDHPEWGPDAFIVMVTDIGSIHVPKSVWDLFLRLE